jgi:hypothetical protein
MTIHDALLTLERLPLPTAIREGDTLFPWIESVHVLAIVVVVGLIALVDLRLVGFPSHHQSIRRLMNELLPITWIAFAIALITGLLLFSSHAVSYSGKLPFVLKMILLVAAGFNMGYFHLITQRNIEQWDERLDTPRGARVAGFLSLFLWIGIVVCGRWIGFLDG